MDLFVPRSRSISLLIFPLSAFLVSWATSSVREDLGVANIALALAVLTTISAIQNWSTGIATSVVSALALNYFHTEPVHSLRIGSSSDIAMVSLLATIGISVSASTAIRLRRRLVLIEKFAEDDGRETLVQLLRNSTATSKAWHAAVDSSDHAIRLTEVRLVEKDRSPYPSIARPSRLPVDDNDQRATFVLPEVGASIEFADPRIPYRLDIRPDKDAGPLTVDRRTVFRLADDIETILRLG